MTQPITDEQWRILRILAEPEDWCIRCTDKVDRRYKLSCYKLSGHRTISIRSILARIDAAEGRNV